MKRTKAEPLPPPTEADKLKVIVNHLSREAKRAEERMAKFHKDFSENPSYALEWADDTFKAAGVAAAFKQAVTLLTREKDPVPPSELHEEVMKRVLDGIRNASQSTSTCSNLWTAAQNQAWAEVEKALRDGMRGWL